MHISLYKNVASLITSGQTYYTVYLGQQNQVIPLIDIATLTDTVSLVCDQGINVNFCGDRQIVIWDNDLNQQHISTGSTLFSLGRDDLTILATDSSYIGVHNFSLYVQLVNYPVLGHFPQSATFTVRFLKSSQMYNVLQFTPTQLFNTTLPFSNSTLNVTSNPKVVNDGCVTYYENNNWSKYSEKLQPLQQQQFDMGEAITVYSVYIVQRDQYNMNNNITRAGSQIMIGNDPQSPFTQGNSLCGITTGNPFSRSQWISCESGIKGQYLWFISGNFFATFSEIMAYQYYFVQVNGTLSVQASSNQADIMLPFQESNPVVAYNSISISQNPSKYINYCYLSNNEAKPTITIELKAYINLFSFILIPLLTTFDETNSGLYSNNVQVQVFTYEQQQWQDCTTIINSNQNPESNCYGYFGNQIKVQRICSTPPCQLGICQIGILSDCNCSKTSFSKTMMNSQYYSEISTLIKSNTTNFKINLAGLPLSIQLNKISQLTDSVSLVCGDGTGNTFCGERTFAIWNYAINKEINLSNSTLFSFSFDQLGLQNLVIKSTSLQDVGSYNLAIKIKLLSYSEAGYFPFYQNFTLTVSGCQPTNIAPITPQISFYYQLGSGPQLYNVSNYTQTPSQCSFNILSIRANLISQIPEAPKQLLIDNKTLQFQLNINNPNLTGLVATYSITAQFETIQNVDSVFNVYFEGVMNSTQALRLKSAIPTPPTIPQLDQNSAYAWYFNFPQVIDQNKNDGIKINLICPDTFQMIFKRSVSNNILSLTLDTSQKNLNLAGGDYQCKFNVTNGVENFTQNVEFTVEHSEHNQAPSSILTNEQNQKHEFIAPIPQIQKISNRGVVFVKWNVEMQNLPSYILNVKFNQTDFSNRVLTDSNSSKPLSFKIQTGSIYENHDKLFVNSYSIIYSQERDLQIQLYFNDQGYVSAISKDSLVIQFNQGYFYSINNMTIQTKFMTTQNVLPRQITPSSFTVNLKQASQGVLYSMAITAVLGSPPFQYFANQILSIIEPLTIITHYILIDLNYPANIQDFFNQIFPLIQYDLFQTAQLYQYIFKLDEIIDSPINDQFNQVGYSYKLAINNIGSLLLFIVLQPILLLTLIFARFLLKNLNGMIARHLINFVNSKLDSLKWNGIIMFYFSAYLVLSMIGWISINDLRFGSDFNATENFSSILGILLIGFSILFPISIVIILKQGYKSFKTFNLHTLPKQKQIEAIKEFLAKYGSIQNFHQQTQTYEERQQFMEQKGGLLQDLRTTQLGIGINQIIGFLFINLFSQALIIFSVLGLIKIQALGILSVMYTAVIQICYLVSVKPYSERVNYYKDLFNHSTLLFLAYLLIVFTDFVDLSISDSGGNQFLYVVLVNIGVNLIFLLIVPFTLIQKYMKYYWKRYKVAKRKHQVQKEIKQIQLRQQFIFEASKEQMINQQKLQLPNCFEIDQIPRFKNKPNTKINIEQSPNNPQIFYPKANQEILTSQQQSSRQNDIRVPVIINKEILVQEKNLSNIQHQQKQTQLLLEEQKISQQNSEIVRKQIQAEIDQIQATFRKDFLQQQKARQNGIKLLKDDQQAKQTIVKDQIKIKKVQFEDQIGMTDISK